MKFRLQQNYNVMVCIKSKWMLNVVLFLQVSCLSINGVQDINLYHQSWLYISKTLIAECADCPRVGRTATDEKAFTHRTWADEISVRKSSGTEYTVALTALVMSVKLRWARLVVRWVDVSRCTILAVYWPSLLTQPVGVVRELAADWHSSYKPSELLQLYAYDVTINCDMVIVIIVIIFTFYYIIYYYIIITPLILKDTNV